MDVNVQLLAHDIIVAIPAKFIFISGFNEFYR